MLSGEARLSYSRQRHYSPSGPAGSLDSPFFLSLYALDGLNEVRRCRDNGPGPFSNNRCRVLEGHAKYIGEVVFVQRSIEKDAPFLSQ
jgi:hypothetical protein